MAILAVFLGTMGIFAGAAFDTQVGRSYYSIATSSTSYNGKDQNLLFRLDAKDTEWNVSIITETTRIINAQLKRVKVMGSDPTIKEITGFEGSSKAWVTKKFTADASYSYYVCVQEPGAYGVSGYYSFYQ